MLNKYSVLCEVRLPMFGLFVVVIDLLLFFSWLVKKYFFVNHIRLVSKKLKLVMSALEWVSWDKLLSFCGCCEKSSCRLDIKLEEPSAFSEFNFVEFQTFFALLSEFKKFTPSNFFDCVKAFEFIIRFSESRELRRSHRSSLEVFKASWVFRPVKDNAKL